MIEVIKPGLLDLVMDFGRPGMRAQGVPAGGAADWPALRQANRLVGNPDGAAGLEMLMSGPRMKCLVSTMVAVTGAKLSIHVNGRPVDMGQVLLLEQDDVLAIGRVVSGARAYLAIRGGILVEEMMGSRSTFLPSGFGGVEGRALRTGDKLTCGVPVAARQMTNVLPKDVPGADRIRVLPGPQIAEFTDSAIAGFCSRAFVVHADSNRIGIRLTGDALKYTGKELASQAVLPGAVQVPPNGQPIMLGWDGPVTGGYPVIAGVIAADLPGLAQLCPGDRIKFEFVTPSRAAQIWKERERAWS